ncbi:MAG: hypothetical protein IT370_20685 [Deltaproteobacteria bacterium]|nr:hypothetical protein [Deltaproteobacteria bacterium]
MRASARLLVAATLVASTAGALAGCKKTARKPGATGGRSSASAAADTERALAFLPADTLFVAFAPSLAAAHREFYPALARLEAQGLLEALDLHLPAAAVRAGIDVAHIDSLGKLGIDLERPLMLAGIGGSATPRGVFVLPVSSASKLVKALGEAVGPEQRAGSIRYWEFHDDTVLIEVAGHVLAVEVRESDRPISAALVTRMAAPTTTLARQPAWQQARERAGQHAFVWVGRAAFDLMGKTGVDYRDAVITFAAEGPEIVRVGYELGMTPEARALGAKVYGLPPRAGSTAELLPVDALLALQLGAHLEAFWPLLLSSPDGGRTALEAEKAWHEAMADLGVDLQLGRDVLPLLTGRIGFAMGMPGMSAMMGGPSDIMGAMPLTLVAELSDPPRMEAALDQATARLLGNARLALKRQAPGRWTMTMADKGSLTLLVHQRWLVVATSAALPAVEPLLAGGQASLARAPALSTFTRKAFAGTDQVLRYDVTPLQGLLAMVAGSGGGKPPKVMNALRIVRDATMSMRVSATGYGGDLEVRLGLAR